MSGTAQRITLRLIVDEGFLFFMKGGNKMIIVMSKNASRQEIAMLEKLTELGFKTHPIMVKSKRYRRYRR